MPTKEDLTSKARGFLEAFAIAVQTKFGTIPRYLQQAVWWSPANPEDHKIIIRSPGSSSTLRSGGYEREMIDWFRVNTFYQVDLLHSGFREQTELQNVIANAGIDPKWIHFGFLVPLVIEWCKLREPLDLTQPDAQALLEELGEAVIGKTAVTRIRDAVVSIDLEGTSIELEEGVRIRPIDEEELWEIGGAQTLQSPPFSLQLVPADNWAIVDIELRHLLDDIPKTTTMLYATREAVVAVFGIVVQDGFLVLPIGMTTKFGSGALGTQIIGSRIPRGFGRFPGGATIHLDINTRQQVQEMWPKVKEIMRSPNHYLGLPLRRLMDGLGRERLDDRIVDYAIGLEALLTASVRDELSYRFALRGATILEEAGEDKSEAFHEFKDFYNARSAIVHGSSVRKLDLRALADSGERLLRSVWNWYLAQGLTLRGATARIDRRIEASD